MKNPSPAKKLLTLVLLVSILFPSFPTKRAGAYVDFANLIPNTVTGITTFGTVLTTGAGAVAGTIHTGWSVLGKNILDALAYGVAQRILSALTENIISWIKGGFSGSPSFAVDTQQIIDDITESIAGDLIREIQDLSVCEFSVDFVYDLTDSVSLAAAKKKKESYTPNCPFDGNLTFGASQFYDDFNRGGWKAFSAALGEGGNPYDVQIATAEETLRRKQEKVATSDKKLSWSNGFTDILDTGDCNYPDDVLLAINGTKNPATGEWEVEPIPQEAVKALQKAHCKTTTPGKIVGDQLTKTLGLDMDRLGFADNMNKIVSAFLDVLTQKTLRAVFAKDSSPSTKLTTILNASETALLNEKIAGDTAVRNAQEKYNDANGHFEFQTTQYDSAKVIYDTAWAEYNASSPTPNAPANPTKEQQDALDAANIILKTEAVKLDLAKSDLSTATTALTKAKSAARTKYTAKIVSCRGSTDSACVDK